MYTLLTQYMLIVLVQNPREAIITLAAFLQSKVHLLHTTGITSNKSVNNG